MQSLLHVLAGLWGSIQRLPFTTQLASGTLVVLVAVLGFLNLPSQSKSENAAQITETQTINLETQTVGAESEAFATFASWPGEIISPNDADVQPPREGTIVSWDVSIGDYVRAGAVLGRLSAAPLTPELASTLAGQAAAVAQAKAKAVSTQTFVEQTKSQLNTFSNDDTALRAIEEAKQSVVATQETMESVLRQSIIKEFAEFTGSNRDVISSKFESGSTLLLYNFGFLSPSLRDKYMSATENALTALSKDAAPQQEGFVYFLTATQLAAASIFGNMTQAKLDSLRKEIAEDQADFNAAVEKYREAVLNVSEKQKEYAERARDTGNKTVELDRDRIVAQSELEGAEAAYRAFSGAITGGTAIVAPKSGYVSSIVSQLGEFVAPGKAVASISSGVQTNKIVRFRIPSNVEVPKKGDKVRIIRPGFAKDIRTAVISGVGTALDGNGAFLADARIDGDVEWPAHLSVRVVPEKNTNQTIAVPFDAVFWNEQNKPRVWLVKEGGIIASQEVKTGRTFGDAVEILEGLALGYTYIAQASDTITEGMRIEEAAITEEPAVAPEGDGHGHSHE